MDSMNFSEKFKCEIADEVKAAVGNTNRTIEDSPYKDYLYELLQDNNPFNKYISKYEKSIGILGKVFLVILILNVLLSYILSRVDPQTDFINFTIGLEMFTVFAAGFIGTIIGLFEKGKAMKHYIPIINENMVRLENEMKSSYCIQERREYMAALHYLCNFIYKNDKYKFDHYKPR